MPIYCLVVRSNSQRDPHAMNLLADAHALGLTHVTRLDCGDLYFIEGDLGEDELQRLATELLCDPIAQSFLWRNDALSAACDGYVIETALRPGVTDVVADQIVRAAHELGIPGVRRASTGQCYHLHSNLPISSPDLDILARRLFVNPVIHRYALSTIEPIFPQPAESTGAVDWIPHAGADDQKLLAFSRDRRAALDLAEMRAIQTYFHAENREPTDIEFETIAQTWSEHCSHKSFKAQLQVSGFPSGSEGKPKTVILERGLLATYIRAATEKIHAPWVLSAFEDNAGIVDFGDGWEVSFKVETHNHPSAIEPFGGANTGVGGVIRDVLGVSAKPIAATDVLCFGPQTAALSELPEGVLHPRRIYSGVVSGVQDYGNKMGIPTVNGTIWYDDGYTANPLVFCGCVGIAPKGKHPRHPHPGDRVIVLGGRTGRDGLRGATFSSMAMDAQTGQVAGASVQIGDPITEKGLVEVIVRARDQELYHAITDCGAGGLSSAVGELADGVGATVDVALVRCKYPGLAPWEVWLSEAQERMVLAVPRDQLGALQSLCTTFDVELTDIGEFTGTNRLLVRYRDRVVLDLANEFLYHGMPRRSLNATLRALPSSRSTPLPPLDYNTVLLKLISHPNIASKAAVIRIYDHEVQGGTVVKPLTGARDDGPSDACVLQPLGTRGLRGIVLSNGINPQFGKRDPYRMAVSVVDEAIRNAVAVGADPDHIALLDNFCWGDPLRPETLGELVEAARGCDDAALSYRTPFISGKDSLNNEYLGKDGARHAIPPTLLISALGLIEDVTRAVTMDFKEPGNSIYLLGESRREFGGSHFAIVTGFDDSRETVPGMPARSLELFRAVHSAMRDGLIRACHDLSEGGLAVAIAEMSIAGRLGVSLELDSDDAATLLFAESNGRLLIEIRETDRAACEACFASLPIAHLGYVTAEEKLTILNSELNVISLPLDTLCSAWNRMAS